MVIKQGVRRKTGAPPAIAQHIARLAQFMRVIRVWRPVLGHDNVNMRSLGIGDPGGMNELGHGMAITHPGICYHIRQIYFFHSVFGYIF